MLRQIPFEKYSIPQDKLFIINNNNNKKNKIDPTTTIIPTFSTYHLLYENHFTIQQLKTICTHYGLKLCGSKQEIQLRILHYLILNQHCITLQRNIRKYFVKKYISLHGPAFRNKSLCTNSSDFFTLDDLCDIPTHQFISICDEDGFMYGFQISSLYQLFYSIKTHYNDNDHNNNDDDDNILNPYNRKPLKNNILKNIIQITKIGNLLHIPIYLYDETNIEKNVTETKVVEFKALDLFQYINSLGNYSSLTWFLSFSKRELIYYYRELVDIWKYRAKLTMKTKKEIFPPRGNPFSHICCQTLQEESNIANIQFNILKCMENMVYYCRNNELKKLGALYILGSLTMISHEAANALPWLYDSFRDYN
jgi:hypothetical protein